MAASTSKTYPNPRRKPRALPEALPPQTVRAQLTDIVLEHAIEGIALVDADWRLIEINRSFQIITGRATVDGSLRFWDLLREPHPVRFQDSIQAALDTKGCWEGNIHDRRGDGTPLIAFARILCPPGKDGGSSGYVISLSDVTSLQAAGDRLVYATQHDALTGLPNRAGFVERLRHALNESRMTRKPLAVLQLDVDRFSRINDSLGHQAGDELLKVMAARLREVLRSDDMLARLQGDEFIVLVPGMGRVEDAIPVARKIQEAIGAPASVGAHGIRLTASIGIALYPIDGEDPDTLVQNADVAMHRARERGGNTIQLYSAEMNVAAFQALILENRLAQALTNQEFRLYYQPRFDLRSGKITGAEALMRWEHPELGLVMPNQFIPAAERNGLIVPMGEWALREACRRQKAWATRGVHLSMAVNIAVRQLHQPRFAALVRQILADAAVEPRWLEIEITESEAMTDADATIATLHELRALGVSIAIDDFGTGYSSLSRLKGLPIATLKIDRSFVRDVSTDKDSRAIAEAIVGISRALKLRTVAEGVETRNQLAVLRELGCDEIQGFLLSPPVPEADLLARLLGPSPLSL